MSSAADRLRRRQRKPRPWSLYALIGLAVLAVLMAVVIVGQMLGPSVARVARVVKAIPAAAAPLTKEQQVAKEWLDGHVGDPEYEIVAWHREDRQPGLTIVSCRFRHRGLGGWRMESYRFVFENGRLDHAIDWPFPE